VGARSHQAYRRSGRNAKRLKRGKQQLLAIFPNLENRQLQCRRSPQVTGGGKVILGRFRRVGSSDVQAMALRSPTIASGASGGRIAASASAVPPQGRKYRDPNTRSISPTRKSWPLIRRYRQPGAPRRLRPQSSSVSLTPCLAKLASITMPPRTARPDWSARIRQTERSRRPHQGLADPRSDCDGEGFDRALGCSGSLRILRI
jgi:hypothetical protein